MANTLCPICLEPFVSTLHGLLSWDCTHLAHWMCIGGTIPVNCPLCRCPWSLTTTTQGVALLGEFGIPVRSIEEAGSSSSSDPPVQPTDVLLECCYHIGPPPGFLPSDERAMRYHAERTDTGTVDNWQCLLCNHEVSRNDTLEAFLQTFAASQYMSTWCPSHHRFKALVITHSDGMLQAAGQACVQ